MYLAITVLFCHITNAMYRYWSSMMSPKDKTKTYQWHLDHYGPDVNYDDFIANFTASKFEPKAWVDLFAESGAKYFVPTTKHHDGFALFEMPSTVSNRNSVKFGPNRDLLKVSNFSCNGNILLYRLLTRAGTF